MILVEMMDLSAIEIPELWDFHFYPSCLTYKEMKKKSKAKALRGRTATEGPQK